MNIAFLSGYDDFEYAKQAIQYNIISYMLKPLTMEGLAKELQVIHQKIDAQFALFRQRRAARSPRQGGPGGGAHAAGAGRVRGIQPGKRPRRAVRRGSCGTGTTILLYRDGDGPVR